MPPMPPVPALDRRIERLRAIARSDQRLDGVLLYGSWTLGEAGAHSDIEAYLSVRDAHADDLVRGEFHVEPAGPGIKEVPSRSGQVHLPAPGAAVLLDRGGRLTAAARRLSGFRPPGPLTTAQRLTGELADRTLVLAHVPARGETARAPTPCCTASSPRSNCSCADCRATPRRTGSRPAGPSKTACSCPTATATPPPPPPHTRRRYAQRHSAAGSGATAWPAKRRNGGASVFRFSCTRKSARS